MRQAALFPPAIPAGDTGSYMDIDRRGRRDVFFVIGGLSLFAHYYTLNGIKNRTVGDGRHGTARWATAKEIESTYSRGHVNSVLNWDCIVITMV